MRSRLAVAAAAVIAVALLTTGTFNFGLQADDYFVVRPHTWDELLRTWRGSWDASGVWPAYYRPLSVWGNALTFLTAGYSASALRLLISTELFVIACLVGGFMRRELGSTMAGVFAAALITFQPAGVISTFWFFQQNHRWSVIATMVALLLWQRRRLSPSVTSWWPIHAAVLVGCLFKEDVIVVEPVLLLWQWARARTLGDVPAPGWRMTAGISAGCVAFVIVRTFALGQFGGEREAFNGAAAALYQTGRQMYVGLIRFRDLHTGTSAAQWWATLSTLALFASAAAAGWRRRSIGALLVFQGVTLAVAAAIAMLVSVPWYTRHHLIALGGVLIAAGGLACIRDGVWRSRKTLAAVLAASLLLSFAMASRGVLGTYTPCSPQTAASDAAIAAWMGPDPAPEYRWVSAWFTLKARLCESGQYHHIDEALRRGELHLQ